MNYMKKSVNNKIINSPIGENCTIYDNVKITNSFVGDHSTVGEGCDIINTKMDSKTFFGRRCIINDVNISFASYTGANNVIKKTDIGKFCSLAWDISIGGGNHNYNNVSTYIDYWFNKNFGTSYEKKEDTGKRTIIGNDVWIGAGVIINNGVIIGDGAVIGAGAVVISDVPPYSIVVGIPGKVIKQRFDDQTIELLEKIKWWDWPEERIIKCIDILRNPPKSIDTLESLIGRDCYE